MSLVGGGSTPDAPAGQGSSRRDVLRRGAWVAGSLAAAATGAAWLHDPKGPARPELALAPLRGLPDFSPRRVGPDLAVVTGMDRAATVRQAIDALGGMSRFVGRGDRVLIKPNVGFATPPEIGASSHPEVVGELVRLCMAVGAAEVRVTDHPVSDPATSFAISGIARAVESNGGRVVLPRPGAFAPVSLPGGRLIQRWPLLVEPLEGVTRVIGVATVKHHVRAGATLGMKNWYGLLGGRRNVFHQDIHGIIVELAQLVRPTLQVLDGTTSMMANGPTGGSLADLSDTGTMIAGVDPVAVDTAGAALLGLGPRDLAHLGMAEAAGLGTVDLRRLKVERAHVEPRTGG